MSLPRYPSYRHSGVAWLGKIPEHWNVIPLGKLTISRCDGPFGSGLKSEHYTESGVRVIRLQNIRHEGFGGDEAYIDADYYSTELSGHDVVADDLLIAGLGDANNTVGRTCVAPAGIAPAMVKADCFRFRLDKSRAAPPFVSAALNASAASDAGVLSSGSTRSRIPLSVMASRRLALPSLSEQLAIAAFLDRETAKIDVLVAEQRLLIELLKEKRQAVISHAVTKGLNPDFPMKDSGVEWLGEVPAHWNVVKLGLLGVCKGGAGFPDEYQGQTDCEIPFFKVADISRADSDGALRNANHTISSETARTLRARVFPSSTIVFAKVGAALLLQRYRWLGRPSCIDNNMMGLMLNERCEPRFLLHVLPLLDLSLIVNPGAVPSINEEQISSQRIVVPPHSEQVTIGEFIDREASKLDVLMNEAQRAIHLLQERRTALISAAVTGQIDVRLAAEPSSK